MHVFLSLSSWLAASSERASGNKQLPTQFGIGLLPLTDSNGRGLDTI